MMIPSLVLGLAAWVLPVLYLALSGERGRETPTLPIIISLGLCGAVLCMQTHYAVGEVNEGDWSALMDVMPILAMACTVLLVVTLALNVLVWAVYRRKAARAARKSDTL